MHIKMNWRNKPGLSFGKFYLASREGFFLWKSGLNDWIYESNNPPIWQFCTQHVKPVSIGSHNLLFDIWPFFSCVLFLPQSFIPYLLSSSHFSHTSLSIKTICLAGSIESHLVSVQNEPASSFKFFQYSLRAAFFLRKKMLDRNLQIKHSLI